ncbi:MAG TPA: hypothetical protein VN811_02250 [Thermoanaerobaculia bacterium]|nr:hypothetical protein [Thermoanaerobaculia bacterium]
MSEPAAPETSEAAAQDSLDVEPAAAVADDPGGPGDVDSRPETSAAWVLLTPLLPWLVALPGGPWLLPLAAPLTVYPAFAARVKARRYGRAWLLAMAWAALLSVGVITLVAVRPLLAANGIVHGQAYKAEMVQWVATGTGKETTPAQFVPEHLLHLGAFLVLTTVSAGYLGLALGAFLMAYMSYFVGSLALASSRPVVAGLAAWVPWSVIRVMAFVLLGVLLARPLLMRQRWPFGRREAWLFALAFAGIAADIALKTVLAPRWGLLLRDLLIR